jgi:hypothetical protein
LRCARVAAFDSEDVMLTHMRAYSTAVRAAAGARLTYSPAQTVALATALILVVAACAPPPPAPVVGPDPADPNSGTPRVDYRSTIGPYSSQRPAAPVLGREQSDGVAPASKPGR